MQTKDNGRTKLKQIPSPPFENQNSQPPVSGRRRCCTQSWIFNEWRRFFAYKQCHGDVILSRILTSAINQSNLVLVAPIHRSKRIGGGDYSQSVQCMRRRTVRYKLASWAERHWNDSEFHPDWQSANAEGFCWRHHGRLSDDLKICRV